MIQDSYLHYFDNNGIKHDVDADANFKLDVQHTQIPLKDGRISRLFLTNNLWRTTSRYPSLVFQHCIFCKTKKFDNESFSVSEHHFESIEPRGGESLFTCQSAACYKRWIEFARNINEDTYRSLFSFSVINKKATQPN